jgi:hypothetical protein
MINDFLNTIQWSQQMHPTVSAAVITAPLAAEVGVLAGFIFVFLSQFQ